MKLGKKSKAWMRDKKKILEELESSEITYCESCGSNYNLSLHHLVRRSHGGDNSFKNIVLLCHDCHHKADNAPGYIEFNERLKLLRGA